MLLRSQSPGNGVGNRPTSQGTRTTDSQFSTSRPGFSLQPGRSSPLVTSGSPSPRRSSERSSSRDVPSPAFALSEIDENDTREILLRAFLPKVAVYASDDTEELIRLKGLYGGFCGLLKPFGESVQGKVVMRDSVGASKSWNDFGVHFTDFGQSNIGSMWVHSLGNGEARPYEHQLELSRSHPEGKLPGMRTANQSSVVDSIVDRLLTDELARSHVDYPPLKVGMLLENPGLGVAPKYQVHYLRKLLSNRPIVPYETFSHPVACIIAISSQCSAPIDTLRDLYSKNTMKMPEWAGNEFLRYYVLVHDEDHDNITSSTTLFNQMKRHFGLHCHLLRLRSVACGPRDEDSTELPICNWLPADIELQNIRRQEQDGGAEDYQQYIFDTDAAVIKTFIREMVTQSIVPFMEGRVTSWNDQVASKRRGIGGRFMNLSKRWTGLGSVRGGSKAASANASGPSFFSAHGFYEQNSIEVVMHRLADYAFMLRDWKLSSSVYDNLRSDFGEDKAWNHQAVMNEMGAMSLLLNSQATGTMPKVEAIDQMLNAALYSYITRCFNSQAAVRCLMVAIELYIKIGEFAMEEATKWAYKLLELSILSPLGQTLLAERAATCHRTRPGTGQRRWGSRKRKAAFWNLLAANVWLLLDRPRGAVIRLQDAEELYGVKHKSRELPPFPTMSPLWNDLHRILREKSTTVEHTGSRPLFIPDIGEVDEEAEAIDTGVSSQQSRRGLSTGVHFPQGEPGRLSQQLTDHVDAEGDGFM